MEQTKAPMMDDLVSERLSSIALAEEDVGELLTPEDQVQSKPRKPGRSGKRRSLKPIPVPGPEPHPKYKQVSFYLSKEEYLALRTASVTRESRGETPFGHEKMARAALRHWLASHGFLKGA